MSNTLSTEKTAWCDCEYQFKKQAIAGFKLKTDLEFWREMPPQEMRLRCGEMSAQEIRTVRAVLGIILSANAQEYPANTATAVDHQPLVEPLDLWLQWHGDGTPEDDGEVCESEVTWSREKIFDHDVEYVHADEIRRALMGHCRSELWGDKGLIAATMRCVDAIGMIEDLVTTDHETKEAFIQRVRGVLGHNA